jgi:predicted acetyltransferase
MVDVRPLEENDLAAAQELGRLAFGGGPRDPTQRPSMDDPLRRWGGFDEHGRLVAKATDLLHEQWWGGRLLPACGVAGVAVAPEQRGQGVTRALLTELLRGARDRGAVVAALFCTTAAVYRALGFEVGGVMRRVEIPTAALPRAAKSDHIRLRAGDGTDWPAVRAVYDEICRTGNGLLSRHGGSFEEPTGPELPDGLDGVTVAEDDSGVVGYASWVRGTGYGASATLVVPDCLALTPAAADALLASVGTWGTVTPTVRLRPLPWVDAVSARLPLEVAREHSAPVWMHRPLDVVAAVAARGFNPAVTGSVDLRLLDPMLPWNDGAWRLVVDAGEGRLERADTDPAATLTVRGWSALWCGAARCAQLRQSGHLTGGGPTEDAGLDLLLGSGGPAALLDYF